MSGFQLSAIGYRIWYNSSKSPFWWAVRAAKPPTAYVEELFMPPFEIGSLVMCREREWVVMPSRHAELLRLRPLGGAEFEACAIFWPLEGHTVEAAFFPQPDPAAAGDFVSGRLLRDAARLALRSGAGPFRCLGRIAVRPRSYQLVPLLMALRLEAVRLLIADDVGIGKTIEAGLIARELLDRGEVRRLTVLCPPHLCDQWRRELQEKFALDAVVVRSSTATRLERGLPDSTTSLWEHYPVTVASIDYVKSERRRDTFLRSVPDLVIVDEAHTATLAVARGAGQQQRYDLVRDLVRERPDGHLLLLTATPHSGIEDAFRNLLGLLAPRFASFNLEHLSDDERDDLARHFVQRRRADVRHWLNEDTPFPQRESRELTYSLARSVGYRKLFDDVFAFAQALVRESSAAGVAQARQRARYWAALALLRCVMSSPAAAEKALRLRAAEFGVTQTQAELGALEAELLSSFVLDSSEQEQANDQEPLQVADLLAPLQAGAEEQATGEDEAAAALLTPGQISSNPSAVRARLRRFAARAAELQGREDPKLQALIPLLQELLAEGYNPIVYCRYIATAGYLAEQLDQYLQSEQKPLRILSITGERSEEEREMLIEDLIGHPRRLLVATDCLSEGINLQHAFDAVIHYDLPWNPNRLEQREGRVDRYGQRAATVRTALIYGKDNPMDAAVMKVLLRKAVSIHRSLGISVPLPVDHGTVVDTLIASLFSGSTQQMSLFDAEEQATLATADDHLQALEQRWDVAVAREKESRTRFAQRRIRPDEVARELEENDAVLGEPAAVESFVRSACERLGAPLSEVRLPAPRAAAGAPPPAPVYLLQLQQLPSFVRERVAALGNQRSELLCSFAGMPSAEVQNLNRNHPFVVALADYVLETALMPADERPLAARSGLIITDAVSETTALLLLRMRALIESPRQYLPLLAEELLVSGFVLDAQGVLLRWLDETEALPLLQQARPRKNVSPAERSQGIAAAIAQLPDAAAQLTALTKAGALRLRSAHQRVRAQSGGGQVNVRPSGPPDVLGVYVLWPKS